MLCWGGGKKRVQGVWGEPSDSVCFWGLLRWDPSGGGVNCQPNGAKKQPEKKENTPKMSHRASKCHLVLGMAEPGVGGAGERVTPKYAPVVDNEVTTGFGRDREGQCGCRWVGSPPAQVPAEGSGGSHGDHGHSWVGERQLEGEPSAWGCHPSPSPGDGGDRTGTPLVGHGCRPSAPEGPGEAKTRVLRSPRHPKVQPRIHGPAWGPTVLGSHSGTPPAAPTPLPERLACAPQIQTSHNHPPGGNRRSNNRSRRTRRKHHSLLHPQRGLEGARC